MDAGPEASGRSGSSRETPTPVWNWLRDHRWWVGWGGIFLIAALAASGLSDDYRSLPWGQRWALDVADTFVTCAILGALGAVVRGVRASFRWMFKTLSRGNGQSSGT